MPNESLRDICRRKVAAYRLKHPRPACAASQEAQRAAVAREVAVAMATDPARRFELDLTPADHDFLRVSRINPL